MPNSHYHQLVPPLRFRCIAPQVYVGAYPTIQNFCFLHRLQLKTIISMIPEKPTTDLTEFCNHAHSFFEQTIAPSSSSNNNNSSSHDTNHQQNNNNNSSTTTIQIHHYKVSQYKDSVQGLSFSDVSRVIETMLDKRQCPLYIHCLDGRHVSSLVVMCIRKLQNYAHECLVKESKRFVSEWSSEDLDYVKQWKGPVNMPLNDHLVKWCNRMTTNNNVHKIQIVNHHHHQSSSSSSGLSLLSSSPSSSSSSYATTSLLTHSSSSLLSSAFSSQHHINNNSNGNGNNNSSIATNTSRVRTNKASSASGVRSSGSVRDEYDGSDDDDDDVSSMVVVNKGGSDRMMNSSIGGIVGIDHSSSSSSGSGSSGSSKTGHKMARSKNIRTRDLTDDTDDEDEDDHLKSKLLSKRGSTNKNNSSGIRGAGSGLSRSITLSLLSRPLATSPLFGSPTLSKYPMNRQSSIKYNDSIISGSTHENNKSSIASLLGSRAKLLRNGSGSGDSDNKTHISDDKKSNKSSNRNSPESGTRNRSDSATSVNSLSGPMFHEFESATQSSLVSDMSKSESTDDMQAGSQTYQINLSGLPLFDRMKLKKDVLWFYSSMDLSALNLEFDENQYMSRYGLKRHRDSHVTVRSLELGNETLDILDRLYDDELDLFDPTQLITDDSNSDDLTECTLPQ